MSLLRTVTIRWRIVLFFLFVAAGGALSVAHLVEPAFLGEAYGWLSLALAGSVGIGWWVAQSIATPLKDLEQKLEKLAVGQWDQVLKDRSGDEIGDVSDALNRYVLQRDNEGLLGQRTGPQPDARPLSPRDREVAGLRSLMAAGRELQTVYDFTDGAGRLLAACNAHLRLEWSSVCLLDTTRQRLDLAATSGLSDTMAQEVAHERGKPVSFAASEGVSGEVVAKGEPVIVNKGDRDPRFKNFSAGATHSKRIHTMACLPLKVGGQTVGLGNFVNVSSPGGFGEAELAYLGEAMALLAQFHLKIHGSDEAFREAVSGLHDEEYWKALLAVECQRVRRHKTSLSMLKLKCVFSRSGVPVTEQNAALATIGTIIRQNLRNHDGAARRKDSFYLFLPQTDTLGALFLAGRLKDRIDSAGSQPDGGPPQFVAAMGTATCPDTVPEPEGLIEACDASVRESTLIGDHRLICYQKGLSDKPHPEAP
jgi:GAF domain-containing protein